MKYSLSPELVMKLLSYEEKTEREKNYMDYWREELKRFFLSLVKNDQKRREQYVYYLEDHDWHLYKGGDWIQELEESDWL
tara:strand:- start:84 stop:323 length:240 start_codon:yes stop_codon:yes gene_type:complete